MPERRGEEYAQWMENIRDWCISRQLWWGHRIPVWYCEYDSCARVVASRTDLAALPRLRRPGAPGRGRARHLVLLLAGARSPAWAGPSRPRTSAASIPADTLVTAPEILFFWVARMVMVGLRVHGRGPVRRPSTCTGTVRDSQHRKMSKSLGNGIDPLDVVRLFGADALRYTLVAGSAVGTDVILDPGDLETSFAPGRNFANKLWNAGRFILSNLEGPTRPLAGRARNVVRREELSLADRWILAPLRGRGGRGHRGARALPPERGRRRGVPVHLERPGRLVHRADQAPPLRRPARRRRGARGGGADVRRGPSGCSTR